MSKSLKEYAANATLPTISEADFGAALEETTFNDGDTSGVPFLSFSGKKGEYSLGRDKSAVDPDQLFMMEPQSMTEGFICWKSSKPIARYEWSLYADKDNKMNANDLEDHGPYRDGEGWKVQLGFGAVEVSNMKSQLKFTNNSKSGVNSIKDLYNESRQRFLADEPYIPVMYFSMEEFTAQEQTNWKPTFVVETWVTRAAVNGYMGDILSETQFLDGLEPKKASKKAKAKKAPGRKRK